MNLIFESTSKFFVKIIINLLNSKFMNVKILPIKIRPFLLKIYPTNGNLVENIKEYRTGRDPPEYFTFRSVKMRENSNQNWRLFWINKDYLLTIKFFKLLEKLWLKKKNEKTFELISI